MTISFSNFDGFEKPKNAAGELPDAEFKAGDFAAIFNVSALVPPVITPAGFAAPESSEEITVAVQPLESNQNTLAKENQIQPLMLQNTIDLPTQNSILPSRENLPDAKFTQSNLTTLAPSKQVRTQAVPDSGSAKKDAVFPLSDNWQRIADGEFPTTAPGEFAPSLKTDISESKVADKTSIENQPKASFVEEFRGQNPAVEKDFGRQIFAGRQDSVEEMLPAIFRRDFAPPLSEKIFSARTQVLNTESNQVSMKSSDEQSFSIAPRLFNTVSEVLNADTFIQTNSAPVFVAGEKVSEYIKPDNFAENEQGVPIGTPPENAEINQVQPDGNQSKKSNAAPVFLTGEKIAAPVMQTASGESGQSLSQPETESPKADMQIEMQANSGGQIFNNFLNAATNKPEVTETAPPVSHLSGMVFEQVEPRIFELAAAQSGEEKRFLKMKLNPAELGAVEITLEKNAAGVINAHFQTESETTRQVLGESLAQLRSSLENSGWQVGNLEISCDSSSSNGGERRENQSQQFGTAAENQLVGTTSFDGNLNTHDDLQSRLVNLRA